jgi:hypothetical protein
MKDQLIDENEYSPQSSEKLAEWNPTEYSGGFRHETETLYQTERGAFFIFFEGGLFSRFHEFTGEKNWYGGTHVQPVSYQEAIEWCEATGNYDTIQKHFSLSRGVMYRDGLTFE